MKKTIALFALATLLAATAAQAVPELLSFQGVIKNDDGTPVPDGIHMMTFTLYDDPGGGGMVWESAGRPVQVTDSTISVLLGESEPLHMPFDQPYWLGITVDPGEEMQPLVRLTSAPYALWAGNADLLGWRTAEAFADTAHMHHADHIVEGVLSIDRIPIGHTADEVAAGNHYHGLDNMADVDTMGLAVGRVLAYDGGMWRPTDVGSGGADDDWTVSGNDQYSAVSGNVGIGTATPGAKLDVQGSLIVGADGVGFGVNLWSNELNSRLWWDPTSASLRIGNPAGGSWAPENMGTFSLASGLNTMARGDFSTAIGFATQATGISSFAAGNSSFARGTESMAFGWDARADTTHTYAIGTFVRATRPRSMVLGSGDDIGNPLVNNIENSLMVGFDTITPTLFVGGPHERVGIGTTDPDKELEVNGTIKTDGFVMSTGSGDGKVLTSDAGGYASWQDGPGRILCSTYNYSYDGDEVIGNDWNQIGSASVTIVAPSNGTIVVDLVADVYLNHTSGTLDQFQLCITRDFVSFIGFSCAHEVSSSSPTDTYRTSLTARASEDVAAGTYTYYPVSQLEVGQDAYDTIFGAHMVAIFYPD
ncbi:hypothetical protein H8E07_14285 [bacterium]|nr:hypothetical protein [bacterium]